MVRVSYSDEIPCASRLRLALPLVKSKTRKQIHNPVTCDTGVRVGPDASARVELKCCRPVLSDVR